MRLLLLAALAQAGVVKAFSVPSLHWPHLATAVSAASRSSRACLGLSALDPLKAGHSPSFDPLVKALGALGQTPQTFAKLPEHDRAILAGLAAEAAEAEVLAQLSDPAADLARLVVTHRMYLDEAGQQKADRLYAAALAQDAGGKLARAKSAAEQWLFTGKLEAGEPAVVLAFDPYRKTKAQKKAELKPAQKPTTGDPKLDVFMMMHGVEPTGKEKAPPKPFIDPLLDPFEAAQQAAAVAAKGKRAFFAEAWSPYYRGRPEKWRFVFYALDDKKDKKGRRLDVRFENGKPVVTSAPAEVDARHIPFAMDRYLMAKGTGFGIEAAEGYLDDLLPEAQIGLTVSLGMRDDGDGIDPYFVFKNGEGEIAGMNGRTGETFRSKYGSPGAPAAQRKGPLGRLWDWLRSL